MVLPPQNPVEIHRILGLVDVAPQRVVLEQGVLNASSVREPPPVQERVADGDVQAESGRRGETLDARGVERGEKQPEARDVGGERIDVHAEDLVERALRRDARRLPRGVSPPKREEPGERSEQEVARAAGGVDQPHLLVAERLDRRGQRAVEDERLDEPRRLEQRVAFPRVLGDLLIEVAEQARVAEPVLPVARGGERVNQLSGRGIDRAQEGEEIGRSVAADRETPERIVPAIEQRGHSGKRRNLLEDDLQPVAVAA